MQTNSIRRTSMYIHRHRMSPAIWCLIHTVPRDGTEMQGNLPLVWTPCYYMCDKFGRSVNDRPTGGVANQSNHPSSSRRRDMLDGQCRRDFVRHFEVAGWLQVRRNSMMQALSTTTNTYTLSNSNHSWTTTVCNQLIVCHWPTLHWPIFSCTDFPFVALQQSVKHVPN